MESPYDCYLKLPDLLALQCPRTAEESSAQWADEHFFIAVHQSAEVLAGQALVDLRTLQQAPPVDHHCVLACLRRVSAVVGLLEQHLALLEHLPRDSFAAFRPLLDDASGAQSSQFAELFCMIDRCAQDAERAGGETADAGAEASGAQGALDGGEAAQAWWRLRSAVSLWRTRHLMLVEWLIGDRPGTGGTSGLAYLRSRIDLPPRGPVEGPDHGGRRH
ncbi:tryptophan 2,3-dioxygenase family protein [Streptomyces sp. NPDC058335]|uniref:tryptophan 2,3-dioxygenase family protein n=1 Tax=Streptomyces sp. NPDC058335 TaxID=3346451 RepID=UPI0036480EE8